MFCLCCVCFHRVVLVLPHRYFTLFTTIFSSVDIFSPLRVGGHFPFSGCSWKLKILFGSKKKKEWVKPRIKNHSGSWSVRKRFYTPTSPNLPLHLVFSLDLICMPVCLRLTLLSVWMWSFHVAHCLVRFGKRNALHHMLCCNSLSPMSASKACDRLILCSKPCLKCIGSRTSKQINRVWNSWTLSDNALLLPPGNAVHF